MGNTFDCLKPSRQIVTRLKTVAANDASDLRRWTKLDKERFIIKVNVNSDVKRVNRDGPTEKRLTFAVLDDIYQRSKPNRYIK